MPDYCRGVVVALVFLTYTCPALGFIKCYCNLPGCIEDENICTSYMEFCFSKIHMNSSSHNSSETPPDVHGCLENLPDSELLDAQTCDGTGVAVQQTPGGSPLLYCCTEDLCNYVEKQKSGEGNVVKSLQFDSTDLPLEDSSTSVRSQSRSTEGTILQVAVIVVPVAGSLILIILIILAVKMLKDDRKGGYSEQGGFKKSLGFKPYFNFNKSSKQSQNQQKSDSYNNIVSECSQPLNEDLSQNMPHSGIVGVHNNLLDV